MNASYQLGQSSHATCNGSNALGVNLHERNCIFVVVPGLESGAVNSNRQEHISQRPLL